MRQSELKKCAICKEGMMHGGCPLFYRLKLERFLVDINAVQRRHGLELMTGSPVLAAVLGPDEDIAKQINSATFLLCQDCALKEDALILLADVATKGE